MDARPVTQGELPLELPNAKVPCKTFWKIVGEFNHKSRPLVALHGGPGAGHEYLSPLYDIYDQHGIPIIVYDQIGCGRSTRFPDKMGDESFWTIDVFIKELDNLIDYLKLREDGFYLFGQSWGGMLAGTYASRRPAGLKKLILASAPSSMPLYAEGCRKLLSQLPDEVRKTIEDHERRGDYESPEFEEASRVFYSRHVCRIDPMPVDIQKGFQNLKEDPTSYITMCGPSEFTITGSLKTWSIGDDAKNIEAETLLLNSRYDEAQDLCIEPWFKKIPKVKWVRLENSSHMLHWEERERSMQLCGDFLSETQHIKKTVLRKNYL